jgi:cation diffusion facilitator CzcD-associated flavoprotein CzcO
VAVIGTGATGIQLIGEIADKVGEPPGAAFRLPLAGRTWL